MNLAIHENNLLLKGFNPCSSLTTWNINNAIEINESAYLWGVKAYGIRVVKARRYKGTIQFKALNSGKWLTPGAAVRFTASTTGYEPTKLHFAFEDHNQEGFGYSL